MQVHDARIVRGAALPTAVAAPLLVLAGAVAAGGKGALGAFLAVALVAAFFAAGLAVLSKAARLHPLALMNVAILTYVVQVALLGVVLVTFRDTTLFDTRVFGWSVLASTLIWIVAQVRAFSRQKILYVEPHEDR